MSPPRQVLRSFFYALVGGYAGRIASVILTVVLRSDEVLGREAFEPVILPFVVFMMFASLSQVGLMQGLLHFRDDTQEFLETHFTLNCIVSVVVFFLTCLAGLGLWFLLPDSWGWGGPVICLLGLFHFLRSLTQTSEALLRRDFQFGHLSLLHGFGTILALGIAVAAAVHGLGRWSLILGGWSAYAASSVVYAVVFSTGVWLLRPVPLRFRLDPPWTRKLLDYGRWLWVGWVLQSFVWLYDKVILGVFVGDSELALYENAWWLMFLPTAVISHIIFNYTSALYSRYQDDEEKLSELFETMSSLVIRCSAPVAIGLVILAPQLMQLLGESWSGSAQIMLYLLLFGLTRPLLDEGYGLLWARGDAVSATKIMASQALIALPMVPLAVIFFGTQGVAISIGLIALWGLCFLWRRVNSHIIVHYRRMLLVPAVACVAAAAAVKLAPPVPEISIPLFSTTYGTILVIAERRRLREILTRIQQVRADS